MMLFLWILVGIFWTVFCSVFCSVAGYLYGRESMREEFEEAKQRSSDVYNHTNIMTPNEVREIVAKNTPEPKPCSFTDKEQGELSLLSKTVFDLVQAVHNMDNQGEIDHALEVVKAYESRLKRVERKTGLNT